jgi:hypothetical protein
MKRCKSKLVILITLLAFLYSCSVQTDKKMISPSGEINLTVDVKNGILGFSQSYKRDTIISFSPIAIIIDGQNLGEDTFIDNIQENTFDETWITVNDKYLEIRNHYNEYTVSCVSPDKMNYQLIFRCYNDGFAYRFIIPEQQGKDSITVHGENTSLNFKENFTYWSYNRENHNVGPINRKKGKNRNILTPIVLKTGEGSSYMAIHEAEIVRYAPISVNAEGEGYSLKFNVQATRDQLPVKTSWRTFIIGNKPGDLAESNLLVNLNEPCKIEDTSWIKPGKSLWDWRVWGYKAPDGFEYGLKYRVT